MPDIAVTCIGSAHWDTIAQATHPMRKGDDVPGHVRRTPGGVALNIALGLADRRIRARLVSAVGGDTDGDVLLNLANLKGVETSLVQRISGATTDQYTAIEGADGELFGAVADATTLELSGAGMLQGITGQSFKGIVVLDGNLPQNVLDSLASSPALRGADLRVVPASPTKASRLVGFLQANKAMVYANVAEANRILQGNFINSRQAAEAFVTQGTRAALVTDGSRPATYATAEATVSAAPPPAIRGSVTGAGDALVAAHIAAEIAGRGQWDALSEGLRSAVNKILAGRNS